MKKNGIVARINYCNKIDKIVKENTHYGAAFNRYIDEIICGKPKAAVLKAYLDGYWDAKASDLIREYPTNEKEVHVS